MDVLTFGVSFMHCHAFPMISISRAVNDDILSGAIRTITASLDEVEWQVVTLNMMQ